jgi:hypothetical protein
MKRAQLRAVTAFGHERQNSSEHNHSALLIGHFGSNGTSSYNSFIALGTSSKFGD